MPVRREEARLRRAAARRQALRCHYCGAAMWLGDPARFLARHGISAEQAAPFQCTAEHLLPRHRGGSNRKANVVAACRHCNLQRHDAADAPDAETWARHVAERMALRQWHPEWAYTVGIIVEPAQ